jgi:zinc transport system ATP-binding protein
LPNTCDHCCTRVEGLTVKLGGAVVLDKVDLHLNCGEVVAVVGPNGAGKTTLLRTMLGELPYQGKIIFRVNGRASLKPKLGYVPQKLQFDPGSPVSVADLVISSTNMRPVWQGVNKRLFKKAEDILAVFSAEHLLKRSIGELSGGELRRVLLAIAMNPEPELLLLDEPAAGVDIKGLAMFYQIVRNLRQKHDIAVILVTHDLAGISSYVDRIVLMNRRVITQGSPEEVLSNEKLIKAFGVAIEGSKNAGD